MHHHGVPAALTKNIALVLEMPVQTDAGMGFQIDVVAQAGLRTERLEQRRDTAGALVVEIGDAVWAVKANRRSVGEGEAVADE